MQDAFAIIVVVVVGLSAIAAVVGLLAHGRAYDEIGRGDLSLEHSEPPPSTHARLEAEVRQLVVARNARRARKGLEPLDVEAEVQRQLRAAR